MDTVILAPSQPTTDRDNREYLPHIDRSSLQTQPQAFILKNLRSWEDPSEEDTLALNDLPTSMRPCPVWRENISINIASDTSTSASETDELFGRLEDDLQLSIRNQDWEVHMLARELERREREKESTQFYPLKSDLCLRRVQLSKVRSLEERGTATEVPSSRQSISSDNISYPPSVIRDSSQPTFRTSGTAWTVCTSSVSPDMLLVPVVTESSSGS